MDSNHDIPQLSVSLLSSASHCMHHCMCHWTHNFKVRSRIWLTMHILPEPAHQSPRVTHDSDLRSGSDLACPLSIRKAHRCICPCGMPCTLTEECTLHMRTHQTDWHIHEHRRAHTHTTHPAVRSGGYTKRTSRARTHVTIELTRHPSVAGLNCLE